MSAAKRKRRPHERARASVRRARASATIRTSGGPLGLRLRAPRSLLLIVDVQEKLVPAIPASEQVLGNCALLLRAAARLGVPTLVSEHCPERLGPTVENLRSLVRAHEIVPKVQFSAADEPALIQRIAAAARAQIVIAGMEAHVCVLQSALGLAERGYRCCVVGDAIGSRAATSHALAMDRLRQAQIPVVAAEMVVFEWLERADRPEFRELLELIR
jgi:nicotinamidase-related amidase